MPSPHEILTALRTTYDLPALAGAIVTSGGLVTQAVVGERRIGSGVAATLTDQFHLGSCTKAMTATLLARLVEQGTLAWETPLTDCLPALADRLHPAYRPVTLIHLLTHTAGLAANDAPGLSLIETVGLAGPPRSQRAVYIEAALTQPPAVELGTFLYSNLGYAVAGAIAETAMNQSWEELMTTHLFAPLGMTTAGFGAMGTPGEVTQPWQHVVLGDERYPIEPGPLSDNPDAIAPAGKVHSSIADWAAFIRLHLQGEHGQSTLLTSETLQRLHTPLDPHDYALGWIVTQRDWAGGRVLTHAGSNTMNFAVVWLAPLRDFAVLAATNQGGEAAARATDAVAGQLINHYLA